jgi:xeroderma pigmentosum group C-complementing protein
MPPYVSRKREQSDPPAQASPPAKKRAVAKPKPKSKQEKKTLFDAADELAKKNGSSEKARKFLDKLDNDDESSLSEADSDEFEDVPPTKRKKIGSEDEAEDDDEMDWEDAFQQQGDSASTPAASIAEPEIGDVNVSVNEDGTYIPRLYRLE